MADDSRTPDTRITPSFDSANVRALPHYDDDTAPLFGPVESGFDLAYSTVRSIYNARDAAENDSTMNDDARLVAVAELADKVTERTTKAFDRGDHDTVSDVLGGPAYLSAMTPETQAIMLRMYHEKANPQTAKYLAAAKAAQDYLDRNAGLFMGQIKKAIGAKCRCFASQLTPTPRRSPRGTSSSLLASDPRGLINGPAKSSR